MTNCSAISSKLSSSVLAVWIHKRNKLFYLQGVMVLLRIVLILLREEKDRYAVALVTRNEKIFFLYFELHLAFPIVSFSIA